MITLTVIEEEEISLSVAEEDPVELTVEANTITEELPSAEGVNF